MITRTFPNEYGTSVTINVNEVSPNRGDQDPSLAIVKMAWSNPGSPNSNNMLLTLQEVKELRHLLGCYLVGRS